jgi:hypothetical protein
MLLNDILGVVNEEPPPIHQDRTAVRQFGSGGLHIGVSGRRSVGGGELEILLAGSGCKPFVGLRYAPNISAHDARITI